MKPTHRSKSKLQGDADPSPLSRSEVMARVHSKDTQPEMKVRKFLHAAGLRYRLHAKGLPGCPDIIFPGRKVAIFVHGCFWHQHPGCKRARIPIANGDYWRKKLQKNFDRDNLVRVSLEDAGWVVLTAWECELRCPGFLPNLAKCILTMPNKSKHQ